MFLGGPIRVFWSVLADILDVFRSRNIVPKQVELGYRVFRFGIKGGRPFFEGALNSVRDLRHR